MTERQAWLFLAKAWDAAEGEVIGGRVIFCAGMATGLCPMLCYLEDTAKISEDTYNAMCAKIWRLPSVTYQDHKWPIDKAGAKARVAFCRLQAKLLTRPSAKKANRSKRK